MSTAFIASIYVYVNSFDFFFSLKKCRFFSEFSCKNNTRNILYL